MIWSQVHLLARSDTGASKEIRPPLEKYGGYSAGIVGVDYLQLRPELRFLVAEGGRGGNVPSKIRNILISV